MKEKIAIIMVVALTATSSCMAAPSIENLNTLQRPSPINPAIPMDPKPAETITVITDPQELAKIKREIGNENPVHAITAPTTVPPLRTLTEDFQQNYQHETFSSVADQATHRQKRDDISTQPLIYRDQHKQPAQHTQFSEASPSATPQTLAAPIPPPTHQQHSESHTAQSATLQSSPNYYDAGKHSEMKRDIPVPLVPKYHHPEETPKEEDNQDDKNVTSNNDHQSTTVSPTVSTSTTSTSTSTTTHH